MARDGQDRFRRAARMLVGGATLLGQPCPYCGGVRVLKDGNAMCVSCGQEPEEREVPPPPPAGDAGRTDGPAPGQAAGISQGDDLIRVLEDKLLSLSGELAVETDREKEIKILDSMGAVMDTLEKARAGTGQGR